MATSTSKHGAIGPSTTGAMYTIQEAIDHVGFGRFQMKVALITGICLVCEAVGMVVLSLLGELLQCPFKLTNAQMTLIPTCGMLGMCVSNPVWGSMSDRYGRKVVLITSTMYLALYGVLTSFSPNLVWVCANLFLLGISLGGTFQSVTLCSEFVPIKNRAHAILILDLMYGLAVILTNLVAKTMVPRCGYQYFLLATSLPAAMGALLGFFLPESVRFLLVSGRYHQARRLVDKMAATNRIKLPEGMLAPVCDMVHTARPSHPAPLPSPPRETSLERCPIYSPKKMARISIPLMVSWFSLGINYFGISIILPVVFVAADGCHGSDIVKGNETDMCTIGCRGLDDDDFNSLTLASVGDLIAVPLAYVLMTVLTRRTSLIVLNLLFSASTLIYLACLTRSVMSGLMFITKTFVATSYLIMLLINVEVFPTTCRSIGVGVTCALYKMGSLITPLIGQLLARYSVVSGFLSYGVFGVLGAIAVFLIPVETKSKELKDTVEERSSSS